MDEEENEKSDNFNVKCVKNNEQNQRKSNSVQTDNCYFDKGR